MMLTARQLAMAIPLAGAVLSPVEAAADVCYYYCSWDAWLEVAPRNAAAIPIDGVLVLQGEQHSAKAIVELEVTLDGAPVAGTIESTPLPDVLVWRPAQLLVPGATYQVTGMVDNPDLPDCPQFPDIPLDFEFHADLGPSQPLPPLPLPSSIEMMGTVQSTVLDWMVCCDGAYPAVQWGDCGEELPPTWPVGFCTSDGEITWLTAEVSLEIPVAPATAGLLSRALVRGPELLDIELDGPLVYSDWQPICAAVKVSNLATGESRSTAEQCFGADKSALLGGREIDIAAVTAAACAGIPYTCEDIEGDAWDPNDCVTWPDGVPIPGPDEPESTSTGEPADTGNVSTTGEEPTGASWGPVETGGPPKPKPGPEPEPELEPEPEPEPEPNPTPTSSGAGQVPDDGESGSSSADDSTSMTASAFEPGCACNGGGAVPSFVVVALAGLSRRRRRFAESWLTPRSPDMRPPRAFRPVGARREDDSK